MAGLALYRKYRPRSFAEVTGQEHVVRTIRNAVQKNLLSHAYLFSGPRGAGKTTMARLLAKAANCTNLAKDGEPCNACSACEEITSGRAIDLVEIDAASNRGIDDMRELNEGTKFAPANLKYKVIIIDEAHQLSRDAANALLKTLEEPPAHAIFVLATTEAHKMIPTIASRCQRHDFRRLTVPQIISRLQELTKKEKVKVSPDALRLLAVNAQGALRDAESLLDKVLTFGPVSGKTREITDEVVKDLLGLVDLAVVGEFVDLLSEKKAAQAVDFLNARIQEGMDPQEFAKNLTLYLRQTLLLSINPEVELTLQIGFTKEEMGKMKKQAETMGEERTKKLTDAFMEAERKMKYASIAQLPLELAVIEEATDN